MTETTRTFTPNWVSSPGDAIADFLVGLKHFFGINKPQTHAG
ncbi:hypothetical protein [Nostoc sp.]